MVGAGADLKCEMKGDFTDVTAHKQLLSGKIVGADAVGRTFDGSGGACPIVTGAQATTMCDCGLQNTRKTDVAIAVQAESIDDGFNSFHCFIDGANVCAFGTNVHNRFNGGGCYFFVQAGSVYSK